MFRLIFLVLIGVLYVNAQNQAIAVLSGNSSVTGTITFKQTDNGVEIEGHVTGLTPGKHGFHVHSKGDLSNGCTSTGSHFNPYNKNHGGPSAAERHVGDLGNIEANDTGYAKIHITDRQISLRTGNASILGRAVVVHEGVDDLGQGDFEDSLTTGHAGGRLACGIIGIASDEWDWKSGSMTITSNIILIAAISISRLFISELH